jgi:hypothetical protein
MAEARITSRVRQTEPLVVSGGAMITHGVLLGSRV